jgi:hypothetical protein
VVEETLHRSAILAMAAMAPVAHSRRSRAGKSEKGRGEGLKEDGEELGRSLSCSTTLSEVRTPSREEDARCPW